MEWKLQKYAEQTSAQRVMESIANEIKEDYAWYISGLKTDPLKAWQDLYNRIKAHFSNVERQVSFQREQMRGNFSVEQLINEIESAARNNYYKRVHEALLTLIYKLKEEKPA